MKIPKELISLTREHHQSLCMANKAINTSKSNDAKSIAALCEELCNSFETQLLAHFTFEEDVLLPLLYEHYPHECERIKKEHKKLIILANNLNADTLLEFGELLKTHTRFEDRELFTYMSQENLAQIGKYL